MTALIAVLLLVVAAAGTASVLTREPGRQAVVLGTYGLALTALFMVLQAPDVALSQLAVGGVAFPVLILLTVAKIRREARRRAAAQAPAGADDVSRQDAPEATEGR